MLDCGYSFHFYKLHNYDSVLQQICYCWQIQQNNQQLLRDYIRNRYDSQLDLHLHMDKS